MAHGIGPVDRVRLSQQVVGQSDVTVGVRAPELGQRGAGPGADLRLIRVE